MTGIDTALPANVDAERTILGAILLDNRAYYEVSEKIEADDFSLDSHQRIYAVMAGMMRDDRAIDIVTLASALSVGKHLEKIGGVAYLASLTEGLPLRPVISEYLAIVRDKALLRRLMAASSAAIARAADQSEPASEVISALESSISSLARDSFVRPLEKLGDYFQAHHPIVDDMFRHSDREAGVPSGLSELDDLTCGFQRDDLVVIAARPGMGKTALAVSILCHASILLRRTCALFSLEMSREQILHRFLACHGSIGLRTIREGSWDSTSRHYAMEAMSDILDAPLYVDDEASMGVQRMRAKASRLKQQAGALDLVIIDQLNHIQVPPEARKYGRVDELGALTRGLKAMAKALEVPVIVLHQLSRANEKRDSKEPVLSDLRSSGEIEQDADVVLFPHRDSYYERKQDAEDDHAAVVIVAKQRNGPTGRARCQWIGPFSKYCNLPE